MFILLNLFENKTDFDFIKKKLYFMLK